MNKIKGLLFDSGRVLNVPATGYWYQSPKFFQIIDKSKFDSIAKVKRQAAFNKAKDYINSIIISSELGVTKPSEQMYKEALKELSLNEDEVIFVDDNPKNVKNLYELEKLI